MILVHLGYIFIRCLLVGLQVNHVGLRVRKIESRFFPPRRPTPAQMHSIVSYARSRHMHQKTVPVGLLYYHSSKLLI
jgi:hypothetical protein